MLFGVRVWLMPPLKVAVEVAASNVPPVMVKSPLNVRVEVPKFIKPVDWVKLLDTVMS
ncbi:MAG: hypothetical protein KCHDKBKB_02011 [Elusimicrobia bacterium]|nr:hypothetical protein [Elusimicrobiota bacterium]MCG3205292.1 hypothetical protein [Elusimicrobiota bacterium]